MFGLKDSLINRGIELDGEWRGEQPPDKLHRIVCTGKDDSFESPQACVITQCRAAALASPVKRSEQNIKKNLRKKFISSKN